MNSISIIIPVFNTKQLLTRCLSSILGQSFQSYEIILVDDGSSDGSSDMCDAYAAEYKEVRVIHKYNGGPAAARNVGLANAKGDYVMFVDSDDSICTDCLATIMDSMNSCPYDVVSWNANVISELDCKEYSMGGFSCNSTVEFSKYLMEYVVESALFGPIWNKLYRMKIIRDYNIRFPSTLGEDEPFNFMYFQHVQRILHLEQAFYNYIIRPGSITTSGTASVLSNSQKLSKYAEDYLEAVGLTGLRTEFLLKRKRNAVLSHFTQLTSVNNLPYKVRLHELRIIMNDQEQRQVLLSELRKTKKKTVGMRIALLCLRLRWAGCISWLASIRSKRSVLSTTQSC